MELVSPMLSPHFQRGTVAMPAVALWRSPVSIRLSFGGNFTIFAIGASLYQWRMLFFLRETGAWVPLPSVTAAECPTSGLSWKCLAIAEATQLHIPGGQAAVPVVLKPWSERPTSATEPFSHSVLGKGPS